MGGGPQEGGRAYNPLQKLQEVGENSQESPANVCGPPVVCFLDPPTWFAPSANPERLRRGERREGPRWLSEEERGDLAVIGAGGVTCELRPEG